MKHELTLKEHLTAISKKRWKDASKAERVAHGALMNEKRWTNARLKAIKEGKEIESPNPDMVKKA